MDATECAVDSGLVSKCIALGLARQIPFRLENIGQVGSGRGLLRHELALLSAAAKICDAEVTEAGLGGDSFTFRPRPLSGSTHHFSLGAAQSTGRLLMTLLPALMLGESEVRLVLEGGTHVASGPAFHYLTRVFIPVLEQIGPHLRIELVRPGYYPSGGGQMIAVITPTRDLSSFEVFDAGRSLMRRATVMLAHSSRPAAERQLARVRKKLSWSESECQIDFVKEATGPGHVLLLETVNENISCLFCGYGAPNRNSENPIQDPVDALRRHIASRVPVDPLLAELLVIPLALAKGGEFRTQALSKNAETSVHLAKRFLGVEIHVEHSSRADATVCIRPS